MKVVIIIPTYNEKGNIERLITILEEKVFPKIKKHELSILVADDNSPDGTGDEVRELMKKWKNIKIIQKEKHGLGAAYVRGMTFAIEKMGAELMFEIDADLSHDPFKVPDFLRKIDEGYDMAIGTRYSRGGSIPSNWGLNRKIFSILGNLLVRIILMRFRISDWTGGFRALRKEVFLKEKNELTAFRGYTFQVSFLHKAVRDGFKIGEVPIIFTDRTLGRSKIAPKDYIVDLLKYIITARIIELRRFAKFLIVGSTGFIIQISTQEIVVRSGLALFFAQLVSQRGVSALRDGIGGGFGAEAAIISNFISNNFWTFNDTRKIKEKSPFILRLLKFNFTSIAAIFIESFSIWFFVGLLGDTLTIAGYSIPTRIIVVIPTIIFFIIPMNYTIYNKIIWKTQYLEKLKHGNVA